MTKKISYSVVLRSFHGDFESTDFIGNKQDCIRKAKSLSSTDVTNRYAILVRKVVVTTSDIMFNPVV